MGSERREWLRAPYVTPVRLLVGGRRHEAQTLDVSEGGLQLLAREKLAMGIEGVVRFAPPLSATAVSLRCSLRWAGPAGRAHSAGCSEGRRPWRTAAARSVRPP